MTMVASMTGLILAGGRARRMQSGIAPTIDKGLIELCGEPLVAQTQRALAPHVQGLLISANQNVSSYAPYGTVIADDPVLGNYLGPLAGIARALDVISTPWLAVLPVDVIRLPGDLVARLSAAVQAEGPLMAYACTPERAHPLCMVLHASLAASLRRYLEGGDRKVQLWQTQHQAATVLFDAPGLFFNINSPEDLHYASQCCRS